MPGRIEEQHPPTPKSVPRNARKAEKLAANVLPIIGQILARRTSPRQIADVLNDRGIKTARGGPWYAATVRNTVARQNASEALAA